MLNSEFPQKSHKTLIQINLTSLIQVKQVILAVKSQLQEEK